MLRPSSTETTSFAADPAAVEHQTAGNAASVNDTSAAASGADVGRRAWPRVAVPQLPAEQQPQRLLLEYLPVEFAVEEPGVFARTITQFYIKCGLAPCCTRALCTAS